MRAKCLIEVVFPDSGSAAAAVKALAHERDVGNRSETRMTARGNTLELAIDAADVVAMRAAANALMRGLQAFEGVEERE